MPTKNRKFLKSELAEARFGNPEQFQHLMELFGASQNDGTGQLSEWPLDSEAVALVGPDEAGPATLEWQPLNKEDKISILLHRKEDGGNSFKFKIKYKLNTRPLERKPFWVNQNKLAELDFCRPLYQYTLGWSEVKLGNLFELFPEAIEMIARGKK